MSTITNKEIKRIDFNSIIVKSKPDIKPIPVFKFSKLTLVANRGIQRSYEFDLELFTQVINTIVDTGEAIIDNFDMNSNKEQIIEIQGDNLGVIGVKFDNKSKQKGNLPEGQHRKIKVNLFLLSLLHEATSTSNLELILKLENNLFNNGQRSFENFSFQIINDPFSDEENLESAIKLYLRYLESDLDINYDSYLKALSKTEEKYCNIRANEYNKTLIASEKYIIEAKNDLSSKIDPNDFANLAVIGSENTWVILNSAENTWVILNSAENEALIYANSFAYSKKQSENDRIRINSINHTESLSKIEDIKSIIVALEKKSRLIFKSHEPSKTLTSIYRSVLMKLINVDIEEIYFITMSIINLVTFWIILELLIMLILDSLYLI